MRWLSLILIAFSAFAADLPQPPLVVRALPIAESNGQVWRVNVTLGNTSQTNLTAIKVSVPPAGPDTWTLPTLAAGEWKSNTIALNSGGFRSLVALVEYDSNGSANSLAAPVQMPEPAKSWWSTVGPALLPVAAGALFTLLGVFLTSVFNLNKERLTARLQWNRFLFEHYDAQYREFITRCAGTVDAPTLTNHFSRLDDAALVPEQIRQRIVMGIRAVGNSTSVDEKRAARDKLLREVRSDLLEPFGRPGQV